VTPAVDQLSLSPLGAGDLIDRTVRLYRRHFTTLIGAAAPPVVASAIGGVLLTIGWREVSLTESGGLLALYIVFIIVGVLLAWLGRFAFLLVMGGASRNLVLHLLWGEPVSARAIYRNVRSRFWGLVGALLLIVLFGAVLGVPLAFVWLMLLGLVVGGVLAISGGSTFGVVIAAILSFAISVAMLFAFFFIMGRFAYVPQVMLVEGRRVGDAFGRSMSLARGNVRRLTAMFLFTSFATYSALMLLVVPLGWYGYLRGVNPLQFDAAQVPLWYAIGQQVLAQAAAILIAPVWMMGLSLLYVDERVRHEGYDIELMARQRLGDMPGLPDGGVAPLAPAVHADSEHAPQPSYMPPRPPAPAVLPRVEYLPPTQPGSILGLNERRDR
jgi:MFS family permease